MKYVYRETVLYQQNIILNCLTTCKILKTNQNAETYIKHSYKIGQIVGSNAPSIFFYVYSLISPYSERIGFALAD